MVQQTTDKFNQYRLVNSRDSMPIGELRQPIAFKKVALREQTNETQNVSMTSPKNSPLSKDEGPISDTTKVSGIKRKHQACPSSSTHALPPNNTGSNGPLVYVRRKHESEAAKVIARGNVDAADSQASRKNGNDGTRETKVQQFPLQESKVSSSEVLAPLPPTSQNTSQGQPSDAVSHGKSPEQVVPELNHPAVINGITTQPSPQRPINQDWKERFLQLQIFLKNCDQANQEEYMQKLRSLSAADRSRHAVILEKRAIQLLLEEGQELQRMKVLNVLGKASPPNQTPFSAQAHSSMATVSQTHSPMQTLRGK